MKRQRIRAVYLEDLRKAVAKVKELQAAGSLLGQALVKAAELYDVSFSELKHMVQAEVAHE